MRYICDFFVVLLVCTVGTAFSGDLVVPGPPTPEEFGTGVAGDQFSMPDPGYQQPVKVQEVTNLSAFDNLLFNDAEVKLSEKERRALSLERAWQEGTALMVNPIVQPDGAIEYVYGLEQPNIVCAVFNVTDIQFQPGEIIKSIYLGDTFRWSTEVGMHGDDTMHIFVKPSDVGLETSMTVLTTFGPYHFRLRSHRTEYMSYVRFRYLNDVKANLANIVTQMHQERERDTLPESNEYLGDLNFNYQLKGKAPFKPTRVYDNGVRTIIELPNVNEAPIFMVVSAEKGLLRKEEKERVNQHVQGNRMVIDAVFDHGVLELGVGKRQQRIDIIRTPSRRQEGR